jgi:hypothetical protein
MALTEIISWLALGVFGAAALISLRSFINNFPAQLKALSILWVALFVIDLGGHVMKEKGIHNHWLYNIFGWLFYLPLALLYLRNIISPTIRKLIKLFIVAFPLLIVIDSAFLEGVRQLQSVIIVCGGAGITFMAAAYMRQLFLSDSNEKISRDPWFWFSFAFIVYFGASVPYLGMFNYLWENYKDFAAVYYFYINMFFTIVLHCLIITGFLCRTNYRKSS